MLDKFKFKEALISYKENFIDSQWPNEQYKWKAVKCFQDNWDIDATDFPGMLAKALSKTYNLLASMNNFPGKMIENFAKTSPEEVRAMFIDLYDEKNDTVNRILEFKAKSEILLEKYSDGAGSHYQHEHAISVYLWLRYPNKHYIYKYGEIKKVADELGSDLSFKKGAYVDNLRNTLLLYEEMYAEISKDDELISLLNSQLTQDCYADPEYRTLTIDIGFYISRSLAGEKVEVPKSKISNTSIVQWFKPIINALKALGGEATPKEVKKQIIIDMALTDDILNEKRGKNNHKKFDNDVAWARNYLVYDGYLDKSTYGIWKLTKSGYEVEMTLEHASSIFSKWVKINGNKEDIIKTEDLSEEDSYKPYTKADFLDEVYMTDVRYNMLSAVLKNKKNIILQGAPGVGKTFAAKRLAYSIMGEKDDNRVEFVQFHQNYSYEDFMMGYKPVNDGFELKYGIFYRFCQKVASQPDKDFFFIIDEINRGNMSKIFGELLMLIEKDYRGTKATLAYDGLSFAVPKNLYIIGMMNTADRSLSMIDYALRRRFSFFDVLPGFNSQGFEIYKNSLNHKRFNTLTEKVCELNKAIELDKSLGKGFCIGHSYFCNEKVSTDEWLQAVVEFDILPMLAEYWFDDDNTYRRWENILRGTLND